VRSRSHNLARPHLASHAARNAGQSGCCVVQPCKCDASMRRDFLPRCWRACTHSRGKCPACLSWTRALTTQVGQTPSRRKFGCKNPAAARTACTKTRSRRRQTLQTPRPRSQIPRPPGFDRCLRCHPSHGATNRAAVITPPHHHGTPPAHTSCNVQQAIEHRASRASQKHQRWCGVPVRHVRMPRCSNRPSPPRRSDQPPRRVWHRPRNYGHPGTGHWDRYHRGRRSGAETDENSLRPTFGLLRTNFRAGLCHTNNVVRAACIPPPLVWRTPKRRRGVQLASQLTAKLRDLKSIVPPPNSSSNHTSGMPRNFAKPPELSTTRSAKLTPILPPV